eukprot:m.223208 g.223208  ORF g.223208 m.223208 type:complete len:552 (+) comp18748_c0_seq2:177-1832(+)
MALPFLPGHTYQDPSKTHHPKGRSCAVSGGVAMVSTQAGPDLTEEELAELATRAPTLSYASYSRNKTAAPGSTRGASGAAASASTKQNVPRHVELDKKVLQFFGYFKQTVTESRDEHYRVRHVKMYYYLEDDTLCLIEPAVPNSGLPQGKLLKRQKVPKGKDSGSTWHWKDLNVGVTLTIYGRAFRFTDCDAFTADYLTRNGIVLNDPEETPEDPYSVTRLPVDNPSLTRTGLSKSDFDQLKQFVMLDRKVLRFYAVWDDRDTMFGELRPFVIHYYLVDDTIEVREVNKKNSGRDPFPLLMKRQKVPRNPKDLPADFPSIVFERKPEELQDVLSPADFGIGETVHIMGRNFLLTDCDEFTKEFYRRNFGVEDFSTVDVDFGSAPPAEKPVAPYHGFGDPDDSLQSCLALRPKAPKKDEIKKLEYGNACLRFGAHLQSDAEDNVGTLPGLLRSDKRKFVFAFRLGDDHITINEKKSANSGLWAGKFMEARKVPLPDCDKSQPLYYQAQDFYKGASIVASGHEFVIDSADEFTMKFLKSNGFPDEQIQSFEQD